MCRNKSKPTNAMRQRPVRDVRAGCPDHQEKGSNIPFYHVVHAQLFGIPTRTASVSNPLREGRRKGLEEYGKDRTQPRSHHGKDEDVHPRKEGNACLRALVLVPRQRKKNPRSSVPNLCNPYPYAEVDSEWLWPTKGKDEIGVVVPRNPPSIETIRRTSSSKKERVPNTIHR